MQLTGLGGAQGEGSTAAGAAADVPLHVTEQ